MFFVFLQQQEEEEEIPQKKIEKKMNSLSLFCLGIFISLISFVCNVSSDCNYLLQSDLLGLITGLFPGPYPEGYCNVVTLLSDSSSFQFDCVDSTSGTVSSWDNDDCSGTAVNTTTVSGDSINCDGSSGDCSAYDVLYEVYGGDCSDDPLLSSDTVMDSSDVCFMLTSFGVDVSYSQVSLSSSSYILEYYSDSDCSTSSGVGLQADTTSCNGNFTLEISGTIKNKAYSSFFITIIFTSLLIFTGIFA